MRVLLRVLAGVMLATVALVLPLAETAHAIGLGECLDAGGHLGVGAGYYYCDGGVLNGAIID